MKQKTESEISENTKRLWAFLIADAIKNPQEYSIRKNHADVKKCLKLNPILIK